MALIATVLPKLSSEMRQVMAKETSRARVGMLRLGETCDSHFENGTPPSRAKDLQIRVSASIS